MPSSTTRRARSSASGRVSSSRQALSGPDSSQQAMQRAAQRLVSCQARKRGARYSSTERPCITECRSILGEADVRLRHDLFGNVLQLGRLPSLLLVRFGRGLLDRLRIFDLHFKLTHRASHWSGVDNSWHELPDVGFRVPRFVSGRAVYCISYCVLPPGVAVGVPGLRQRHAAQISANMRKRCDNFYPPVWQHQQRCRRLREARSQTILHVEWNVAKFQVTFNYRGMPLQQVEELPVRLVGRLKLIPESRGGADAHEPAGIEAERAQGTRTIDDALGLMDIEACRGESDLQRQTRRPHGAARSMRLGQRTTRALAASSVTCTDRMGWGSMHSSTAGSRRWPVGSILSCTRPWPRASASPKK